MNILVTGANGQLGKEIHAIADQYQHTFIFKDRAGLDIGNKPDILKIVEEHNIDAIINCAAYTAVDKAETEKDLAYKVNAFAVKNLAEVAADKKIRFIHFSTDFVFNGRHSAPIKESETTAPLGVYGFSKLKGEGFAISIYKKAVVIRTAWVYSEFGNNFVKTMLRLGKDKSELNVVSDQIGSPTYAADLAKVSLLFLDRPELKGVFNYSNEGQCSWYEFATEIMKIANLECEVKPIPTTEYPTPAERPAYSVLDKQKIRKELNIDIAHWQESLKKCINKINIEQL